MNLEIIKKHCQEKGYTSRACRFKVIADLLGIDEFDAKRVEMITRYIREIFPKDKVGAKKEAEWHTPQYIHQWNTEHNKLF